MYIEIDKQKCKGHAHCAKVSPLLWGIGKDGKAFLKKAPTAHRIELNEALLEEAKRSALVCPEYAIDILKDDKSILGIEPKKSEGAPVIEASYNSQKEWKMDPKGFFTIKPFPEEGVIRVRYYNEKHQLALIIEGRNAEELYNTIVRKNLISKMEHAAYIGCELMKAEIAMKLGIEYEQDSQLDFSQMKKAIKTDKGSSGIL